jgi:hypothetical protein
MTNWGINTFKTLVTKTLENVETKFDKAFQFDSEHSNEHGTQNFFINTDTVCLSLIFVRVPASSSDSSLKLL